MPFPAASLLSACITIQRPRRLTENFRQPQDTTQSTNRTDGHWPQNNYCIRQIQSDGCIIGSQTATWLWLAESSQNTVNFIYTKYSTFQPKNLTWEQSLQCASTEICACSILLNRFSNVSLTVSLPLIFFANSRGLSYFFDHRRRGFSSSFNTTAAKFRCCKCTASKTSLRVVRTYMSTTTPHVHT